MKQQKQHASAAAPFIKPCGTRLNAPATDRLIEPPAVREARVAMLARSHSVGLCLRLFIAFLRGLVGHGSLPWMDKRRRSDRVIYGQGSSREQPRLLCHVKS